jgi:hypothetical protein
MGTKPLLGSFLTVKELNQIIAAIPGNNENDFVGFNHQLLVKALALQDVCRKYSNELASYLLGGTPEKETACLVGIKNPEDHFQRALYLGLMNENEEFVEVEITINTGFIPKQFWLQKTTYRESDNALLRSSQGTFDLTTKDEFALVIEEYVRAGFLPFKDYEDEYDTDDDHLLTLPELPHGLLRPRLDLLRLLDIADNDVESVDSKNDDNASNYG